MLVNLLDPIQLKSSNYKRRKKYKKKKKKKRDLQSHLLLFEKLELDCLVTLTDKPEKLWLKWKQQNTFYDTSNSILHFISCDPQVLHT
jgi:hypothetical protein